MKRYLETLDFDTVDDLVEEIVDNVINEEEYTSCTVVTDSKLAVELVHKILEIKDSFYPAIITYDSIDYDGFYYVTVDSKCDVYCSQVINDGVPFLNESDYTYIQETVPKSLVEYFGDGYKVIFGLPAEFYKGRS